MDLLLLRRSGFEGITYVPDYENAGKVVRIPLRSIVEGTPMVCLASVVEPAWGKKKAAQGLTDRLSVFRYPARDRGDYKIETKNKSPYLDSLASRM